ncbi:MAG TPA: hypothetical protein V6C58_12735, partial [Allocoleopsis sp.]
LLIMTLHLAQVQKSKINNNLQLRLLADQQGEFLWKIAQREDVISLSNFDNINEGMLVLVELDQNQEIINIADGKDWVLNLVEQFLTIGVTPEMLIKQAEEIENWQRDLTLKSQELGIKTMELASRMEKIQTVEASLKQEN